MVLAHLSLKSNSRTIQRPYEEYIKRTEITELNQTRTFISIYKQVQFTFDNLTPSSVNQELRLAQHLQGQTTIQWREIMQ